MTGDGGGYGPVVADPFDVEGSCRQASPVKEHDALLKHIWSETTMAFGYISRLDFKRGDV